MDIFAQYATDESKERQGVWRTLGDARLLVARANNRDYARRMRALVNENQQALDGSDKDAVDRKGDEITIQVMAETILLGWEGITYKGQPLAHSVENAKMLLQHRDFRVEVAAMSDDISFYRIKEEVAQGNA